MRQQTLLGIAVVVMILSYIGIGIAVAMDEAGNARKGRFLFRQECRPCHMENPVGDVPAHCLGPDSKTQANWTAVFDAWQIMPCVEHWGEKLLEHDRLDIYQYLYNGAIDSPTPEKCG